jgi:hypothetical protein
LLRQTESICIGTALYKEASDLSVDDTCNKGGKGSVVLDESQEGEDLVCGVTQPHGLEEGVQKEGGD